MNAIITGTGTCLPNRVVKNEEIASRIGIEPEQIFKSSGIRQRHWAEAGTSVSSLAASALTLALADASLDPSKVEYLLFGTMTPDRFIPGSAPSVQKLVSLPEIPCLDIRAACCNTIYGLQLAHALIKSGVAGNVAICLGEVQSPFLDLSPDAGTLSMLFGDGASALVVSSDESRTSSEQQGIAIEVLDVFLATDGKYIDDLGIRRPGSEFDTGGMRYSPENAGDFLPRMNGQSVILQASRRLVAGSRAVLERNNLSVNDIRWIVPHQANANLLAQVARGLGVDRERVVSVLEDSGNTSSASMGIALDKLRRSEKIGPGDYVLMPAFAAGFTWGAALCRAVK